MLISVITNCYNSSATLERVYKSLLEQIDKNFEWILIDDYSNDNGKTKEMILHYSKIAPFPVHYKFLEQNHYGSKSTYTATTIANGEYACLLDHDDELMPDAIKKIKQYILKYEGIDNFVGVCGRCVDEFGNLIGKKLPFEEKLLTESEVRFVYKNNSELFQFTKTTFLNEAFSLMKRGYTNGFCWLYISQKGKYLYVNDVIRIYHTTVPTSHSNAKKINLTTVEGYLESLKYTINIQTKYFKYNIIYALKLFYQTLNYTYYSDKVFYKHFNDIKQPYNYFLIFIYPFFKVRKKLLTFF
jgi:glycosyltransferase involved in cell wall biosynthesis